MAFKLLKSTRIVKGRIYNVNRELWRGPDGRIFERHTLVHPGAVAILPRDGKGRYLLIRQFRAACRGNLLEIPAGTMEPREKPLSCATRELIEETGFAARRWKKLGDVYVAPGYSTEKIVIYLAWDLKPAYGEQDEDEHISLQPMTVAQLRAAVKSHRIEDGKTLSALLLAGVV
jgi:ADP-ribose pyrophosphatase